MIRIALLLALSLQAIGLLGGTNDVLTTVAAVNALSTSGIRCTRPFRLHGTVVIASGSTFFFEDGTARMWVAHYHGRPLANGEIVSLEGVVSAATDDAPLWKITRAESCGKSDPPRPVPLPIAALDRATNDLQYVQTAGAVVDILPDELDGNYVILFLQDGTTRLPAFFHRKGLKLSDRALDDLKNATVRVTGTFHRTMRGFRKYSGSYISGMAIETVAAAPQDPFAVPTLETSWFLHPDEINTIGRRRVCGRVLATWGEARLLLHSDNGLVISAKLGKGKPLPEPERHIELVGYPQADLFSIDFRNASWRAAVPQEAVDGGDIDVCSPFPALDAIKGKKLFARLMAIRGVVRSMSPPDAADRRIRVEADGAEVTVDVTTHPEAADGIAIGAEIEATGRCLVETETRRHADLFPRITGLVLVVRSAADVLVVRNPSWWTPARFLAFAVGILALLAIVMLWNFSLHYLVLRRGHQLFRAEYKKASSDLRVLERTNLAVELHDALSQTLTGVSFELKTVGKSLDRDLATAKDHLMQAENALSSCRNELRNCIWDLRNDALGLSTMTEAIRTALAVQIRMADLSVRFNVPRDRVSDKTTHAVLRIIRELTANAMRHGHATKVRIAGSLDGNTLRFSVADDGCGFDPANAPGVTDGHFGLHGIRERLASLNGTLDIASSPGRGTKATVTIHAVEARKKENS